jgi:hypothetical protein
MFKKAEESALMIGELLLILLKFTFGETNMANNKNRTRTITEAMMYLLNSFPSI